LSAGKTKTGKTTKAKRFRSLVAAVLPEASKALFRSVDADDPDFLKVLIEATAAQYLTETKAMYQTGDPVYRRLHSAQSARFSEELRKLMYLRVQAESDRVPEAIEVIVLGL
jgi:hypothetical protein